MKLTKLDRETTVAAIMADVPTTDYQELARKLVEQTLFDAAPKLVQDFWTAQKRGEIAHRLDSMTIYMPGSINSIYTGLAGSNYSYEFKKAHPDTWAVLEGYAAELKAQKERQTSLRNQLTAVLASCSTLKQAQERLPEFEKYLPKERDATGVNGLPMVANVVSELVKAGWPKGTEVAA